MEQLIKVSEAQAALGYAAFSATMVLTRLSGKTLRIGLPGAFTYNGFQTVILPLIPEVAAQSALDRAVFAGGCAESSETSVPALEQDILKLYSDDFIAQWEGFLRDVRLAPITDLTVATANLKDLASPDSTLKRLLTAVVTETDLLAVPPEPAGGSDATDGILSAATKKLGKLGKLVSKGAKAADKIGLGGNDSGPPADPPSTSPANPCTAASKAVGSRPHHTSTSGISRSSSSR